MVYEIEYTQCSPLEMNESFPVLFQKWPKNVKTE